MSTMTITDFLRARIAEDEHRTEMVRASHPTLVRGDWCRALAECEAKRRVVEMYLEHDHSAGAGHHWSGFDGGYATATDHALTALAAVYADHDDYDPGWAPS